jgi:predicted HTH domain antitoxin
MERKEEKQEIAINAIQAGLSDEVIAQITNLSIGEIQELRL